RRQQRKVAPGEVPAYPRFDLNQPAERRVLAYVAVFSGVFVIMSAFGSYRAYQFTDTVTFCGETCHTVMKPEFTAYPTIPPTRAYHAWPATSVPVQPGTSVPSFPEHTRFTPCYVTSIRGRLRPRSATSGRSNRPANNVTGRKNSTEPSSRSSTITATTRATHHGR